MTFTHALRRAAATAAGVTVVLAGAPAQAGAAHVRPAPFRTITTGLEGPFGVDVLHGKALVAEAGSGEITAVDLRTGQQRTLIAKLPGPAGVAARDGRIYVVLGGGGGARPRGVNSPPARVWVADAMARNFRFFPTWLK